MSTDPFFCMTVADVFAIQGRGLVATGRIERGTLNTGDEVFIHGEGPVRKVTVAGLEMARKMQNQGNAGDNVGVLLRDLTRKDIQKGDLLTGSESDFAGRR